MDFFCSVNRNSMDSEKLWFFIHNLFKKSINTKLCNARETGLVI